MNRTVVTLSLLLATASVSAADYVSVADRAAILYDAPSLKAKKLFIVGRYLPLEQIVSLDNWVKVRDNSGKLFWMEKRSLSSKHFVAVTATQAAIRLAPDAAATVVFQAQRQVALEWLERTDTGWIKVRHQDGATGYVKTADVWGD
jgi:SH3 domain protein